MMYCNTLIHFGAAEINDCNMIVFGIGIDPLPLNVSASLVKHHTTIQRTMLGNVTTVTLLIPSGLDLSSAEIEI